MFFVYRRNNAMVGFVEVSETSGSKYGMGSGVPIADTRPVVSNLAVDPLARRFGIGTALMDACEDLVKAWCFEEIILQVHIWRLGTYLQMYQHHARTRQKRCMYDIRAKF